MILIFLLCNHTQKLPVITVYALWTIISLKSAVVDDFLANIKLEKVQISFYTIQKEKGIRKSTTERLFIWKVPPDDFVKRIKNQSNNIIVSMPLKDQYDYCYWRKKGLKKLK